MFRHPVVLGMPVWRRVVVLFWTCSMEDKEGSGKDGGSC